MAKRPVYAFKPWARLSGDPQAVGEALEALKEKHGTLSTDAVVKAARVKSSCLHNYFEWDNAEAAEEHRKSQAGHLIRALVVIEVPGLRLETPTRAFVSVPSSAVESDEPVPGTYLSISEAVRVRTYRDEMIAAALRDLDAYRSKYQILADLRAWSDGIKRARMQLAELVEEEEKAEA